MNTADFAEGLLLGLGLFAAPGPKDSYLLRLGLAGGPVLRAVCICVAADAVLIVLGMAGLALAFERHPMAQWLLLFAAGLYLLWFGGCRLRASVLGLSEQDAQRAALDASQGSHEIIRLSLLNPHAWLDTVFLIGPLALSRPQSGQAFFALGAMLASLAWFTLLALGSARLGRLFQRAWSWRALDLGVALVAGGLAVGILFELGRRFEVW